MSTNTALKRVPDFWKFRVFCMIARRKTSSFGSTGIDNRKKKREKRQTIAGYELTDIIAIRMSLGRFFVSRISEIINIHLKCVRGERRLFGRDLTGFFMRIVFHPYFPVSRPSGDNSA